MEPRISRITLGVADIDRAVEFYHGGLGFPVDRWENAAFFELGGAWLSVTSWEALAEDAGVSGQGTGFDGVTLAHNVESREAVDAVLSELVGAGGTLTQPARETDWGGYSGYVADPDGHLWEVAWNPPRGPDERGVS